MHETYFFNKDKLKILAATSGESIRHLVESSAKPMRSRGFNTW
jgi:hypothetical protein